METSSNNVRDALRQTGDQLRRVAGEERRNSERLAGQLSRESIAQLQRAIEGILAIPTATALGLGSATLYAAAFLERGFELLQQSSEALRTGLAEGRRELSQGDQDADGRRLRSDRNFEQRSSDVQA